MCVSRWGVFLVLELLCLCVRVQIVPGGGRLLCHPAPASSPSSEPCTSSCSTSASSLRRLLTETSSFSRSFPTALPASLRPSRHQLWHPSDQPVARISPASPATTSVCEDHPWSRDLNGHNSAFLFASLPPRPQKPRLCGSSSSRKPSFSSSSLHHVASSSLSLSPAAVPLT